MSLSSLFVLAGVRHGPDTSQSAVCRRRPRTGKVPQNQPSLQVLFFRRAIHCMLEIDFDFILILTLYSVFFSVFSWFFFYLALFLVTEIFLAPAALEIRTTLSHWLSIFFCLWPFFLEQAFSLPQTNSHSIHLQVQP